MKGADRKAAAAAYKERKSIPGIFAVRCVPAGKVWIGESPNIDTHENRLWFTLRQNAHMNRELQAAWVQHGADAFTFEQLERLEPEDVAYVLRAQLKDRAAAWLTQIEGSRRL
jgi:hypothetical protein